MSISFWVTLVYEAILLFLLIKRQAPLRSIVYLVMYQLAWDNAFMVYRWFLSPHMSSVVQWLLQSILYGLQMWVAISLCRTGHKTNAKAFSYLTYSASVLLALNIGDQWLRLRGHGQQELAAGCGSLVLAVLAMALFSGEAIYANRSIWLGMVLWSGSEIFLGYTHHFRWYPWAVAGALLVMILGQTVALLESYPQSEEPIERRSGSDRRSLSLRWN
jgi:hypothetical protein